MVLADNNWVLVFWSLLVFLSFSLFFYLLFITLQNYLAYGTNIQLNVGSFGSFTINSCFPPFPFAVQLQTIPIPDHHCLQ
jgi:hypothetical protein